MGFEALTPPGDLGQWYRATVDALRAHVAGRTTIEEFETRFDAPYLPDTAGRLKKFAGECGLPFNEPLY